MQSQTKPTVPSATVRHHTFDRSAMPAATARRPSLEHYRTSWRELLARGEQVLAPTYTRPERLLVDGDGAILRDATGQEYLDMSSGIAVLALGHCSPVVREAICEAARHPVHVSNLYHTAPAIELASRLVELSFADRVFFANSGAEAVEAAIKLARLSAGTASPGRHEILSFEGSFHGRTFGALAATDRADYQEPFKPLPDGFISAPWSSDTALPMIGEHTAAVLVEPIQGEMGVRVADPAWLARLRERCDQVGALLVFDEIQCGLGRTGRLWAHSSSGVSPDLMTLAKPLGGGLPIGAVLMTEQVAQAITPGCHGTTFGGGPLVTSVALAVLDRLADPELLARVAAAGQHLEQRLETLAASPAVIEVRGEGLMRGVRVVPPVARVVDAALERGLLVVPSADQVIRILPPLEVSDAQLDQCVEILGAAIDEVFQEDV